MKKLIYALALILLFTSGVAYASDIESAVYVYNGDNGELNLRKTDTVMHREPFSQQQTAYPESITLKREGMLPM